MHMVLALCPFIYSLVTTAAGRQARQRLFASKKTCLDTITDTYA